MKIVIGLGGNALRAADGGNSPQEQLMVIRRSCKHIAEIIGRGHHVVVVHGNGPQVGEIMLAFERAKDVVFSAPFDVAGAMSQGYIGYQLQQSLGAELAKINISKPVISLVTQVLVERNDEAFKTPTKPVGVFYSEEEATAIALEKGCIMKEDAGRGFRQVVASPLPKKIVEIDAIRSIHESAVVIAAGGGGVPVIEGEDGQMEGIAAVIDKDLGAELLAEELEADILLILTAVKGVAINYGKPQEKYLKNLSVKDAENYIREGEFHPGSMLPKVRAGVKFVKSGIESGKERKAIIASLDEALEALDGKAGTHIIG